jgi:hypothetical protein
MIEPRIENQYNIILSIFLGIVIAIIINWFYEKPITKIIYKNKK